jgi:hypothetical protein
MAARTRPQTSGLGGGTPPQSRVTPVHTNGNALAAVVVIRTLSPWNSHGAFASTPLHPYAKNQHFR